MQFFNESVQNVIKMSLKFVPKGSINNKEALGQVMVPNRLQAITRTQFTDLYMRH